MWVVGEPVRDYLAFCAVITALSFPFREAATYPVTHFTNKTDDYMAGIEPTTPGAFKRARG